MSKILLTGWWFTDATRQVDCSKCGQKAGNPCRTTKGRKASVPHGERCVAVRDRFGSDEPWQGHAGETGKDRVERVNKKYEHLLREE